MGGREKHAAGTLKFSISISTSGRGNLRRRGGLLRASRETEAPNSSHHLFLYITQNPTAKGGCKVTQQRGGPGAYLGSSASSMVGSIPSSSVPAAAGLLGTDCLGFPMLSLRGVRVPRAGTAGRLWHLVQV